jgi:hypothetical protein
VHQLGSEASKLVGSRSSWGEYINMEKGIKGICEKGIILGQFENIEEYKKFAISSVDATVERRQEMKDFEKFLLE